MTSNHLDDIERYCHDVESGKRLASKWEKLAVARHINDLKRSADEAFPFRFDPDAAARVIRFTEAFPHVKGRWARATGTASKIRLDPWQKFVLGVLFGWLKKADGLRRFRIAYVCVPRKNGKSTLAAAIGLYMMSEDEEPGAEVYCGATSEKQAWEVFRPAKQMAEKQPFFREGYGVSVHAKRLQADRNGSKALRDGSKRYADGSRFEPVIGKPGDGSSPHCAILDEVHEHQDDSMYDTMLTGMGARDQPMLLMVTTAGSNVAGPCYSIQKEVESVLNGTDTNDELFGIIYTIDDPETEWRTEAGMIKANPNIDVSVSRSFLEARVRDAENNPRRRSTVLTKHFNVWVTAKNAWLNMLQWSACADDTLRREDFEGETATLGLDLSETDDLTASVLCFKRMVDGQDHYYFFGRYYTTEEKAHENNHYDEWIQTDSLNECDGGTIDYELVEEHIASDAEQFLIPRCFYDPHGAANLAQRLQKDHDIEAVKVGQSYTNFSAPMRDFESLLKEGRIHHDGNPCLTWMMGNVVAKETMDGKMLRPVKESREAKIDGAVALLMAFIAAYNPEDDDEDIGVFLNDPIIL